VEQEGKSQLSGQPYQANEEQQEKEHVRLPGRLCPRVREIIKMCGVRTHFWTEAKLAGQARALQPQESVQAEEHCEARQGYVLQG